LIKKTLSISLIILLFQLESARLFAQNTDSPKPTFQEIYKDYSFTQTAQLSTFYNYTESEIKKERKRLEKEEKKEAEQLKKEQRNARDQLKKSQNELKNNSKKINKISKKYESKKVVEVDGKKKKETVVDEAALKNDPDYQTLQKERNEIVCQVEEWRFKSNKIAYELKKESTKRYFEVLHTQVDLIEIWPEEYKKIQEDRQSGAASDRLYGNPEDIPFRDLGVGDQTDDLVIFQNPQLKEYIKQMKEMEYKNPYVKAYVVDLVQKIAKNSDVRVPILEENIFILEDKDVNAFAFPGGIIGITTGLLEKAENEAELAGVIAHELAHVAARHGNQLMKKAQRAGMIFNIIQVVAMIFTGGTASFLAYMFLQYGFMGLGMVLNLTLLGVSREYELEADILGMQYLQKAGYDPMSFMMFFEKMGRDKGYVRKTSFFRTHPSFAERTVKTLGEYEALAPHGDYITNSTDFIKMQANFCVDREIRAEEKEVEKEKYRPSLHKKEEKEKEEQAKIAKECGIEIPEEETSVSFCENPELQPFIEEIRKLRKEELKKEEEENKVELKR